MKIAKYADFEEHLNQYDVIHLDIAYLVVQNKSSLETVSYIQKCVIEELREAYVPNEEVRTSFANAVQDTDWTPVVQAIRQSDRLLRAMWNRDIEAVAKGINEVHMANTFILKYNDENALSCVITLAYYNAVNEYTLIREMPSGKGYADIVFFPRKHSDKPAMVIELKYNQSAEGAIAQIKERKYSKALEEYQGNLLLVGINYDKEKKEHSCVIEEMCC